METYDPKTEPYRLVLPTKIDFGGHRASYNEIHIMQYDRTLPVIACELYFNGEEYKLGQNANAKVRWSNPDGKFSYKNVLGCSEDRTIIYFEVTQLMTYCHGKPRVIIELIDNVGRDNNGNGIMGSSYLNIVIDRNPIKEGDIEANYDIELATVAKTNDYNDLDNKPTVTGVSKEYVAEEDNKVRKEFADADEELSETLSEDIRKAEAKVDSETSRATSAESVLDSKISTETSRAQGAEDALDEKIDSETSRAQGAEDALDEKIDSEISRAKDAEKILQDNIDAEEQRALEAEGILATSIEDINKLIPNQASENNKLADKDFVNSSITTNRANYIYKIVDGKKGPFDSLEELEAQTLLPVTNNDYAFVKSTDDKGNTIYTEYKATVTPDLNGITWAEEFPLNNNAFTIVQWAALNSGATEDIINNVKDHIADDGIHVTLEDKERWNSVQGAIKYITLTGSSGTLTSEQLEILKDTPLNYIRISDRQYKAFAWTTTGTTTYWCWNGTTIKKLAVTMSTGAWSITDSALQTTTNLVTTLSSSSTNTQYPSAKTVYNHIQQVDGTTTKGCSNVKFETLSNGCLRITLTD